MKLAPHFQSPILKYFYDVESDIVSGLIGKGDDETEARKEFRREMIEQKKIVFSKEIVHFDGTCFQNLGDKEEGEYKMIEWDEQRKKPIAKSSDLEE